jgi:DNA-binding NarL/FixJ family response regulator
MKFVENGKPLTLLLIDDLIFVSKISLVAKNAGVETRALSRTDLDDIDQLVGAADMIIVDLNIDSIPVFDFLRNLYAAPTLRDTRIICFVSHIRRDLIDAAKAIGVEEVLSRSQFVESVEKLFEGIKEK